MARYQTTYPGYTIQTQARQIRRGLHGARVLLIFEEPSPDASRPRRMRSRVIHVSRCSTQGQAQSVVDKWVADLLASPEPLRDMISTVEAYSRADMEIVA